MAATCTAGDADKDGSCDDVDPTPGNPDGDGDGQVDGMDLTPKGKGSSHSSDSGLSPLAWGLIGVGTYLVGSYAYNALEKECTFDGAKTYCVVHANWDYDKNYMTLSDSSAGSGKLKIHLDNVEVNDAYWIALGSGAILSNMFCKADMIFSYKALKSASNAIPQGEVTNPNELKDFSPNYHYVKINNKITAASTTIETSIEPNGGCDGDGVTIRCGSNQFCMEASEFGTENMPFQSAKDKDPVQINVAFKNFIGASTGGVAYDPEHYMTLYPQAADQQVKIPQGWYRDTSGGFNFDPKGALTGKWKPQVQ